MLEHTNKSPRIDEAIRIASYAHRDQRRKITDAPYIVHPFGVMEIAASVTEDEDTLIACLLHDVLEDAEEEFDRDAMESTFGERVVEIVNGVTKDNTIPEWYERSLSYLRNLQEAPIESVIVSAADKIHNLQSIIADYEILGEELWTHFRTGKEGQLWWYTSILAVLEDRLPESPLTKQLSDLLDEAKQVLDA